MTALACRSKIEPSSHVAGLDADDFAATLNQAGGFNVVDGGSAEILESAQQRDSVAGVVKLAVVIENAAAEMVAL